MQMRKHKKDNEKRNEGANNMNTKLLSHKHYYGKIYGS